jgi:hypothetical protein
MTQATQGSDGTDYSESDRTFLSPSGVSLTFRPSRGAKIVSLRDPAGNEWLAQSEVPQPSGAVAFASAEMAGWDECAPTITACIVNGRHLPDHGDAWDTQWVWSGWEETLSVEGRSWPYRLERSVEESPAAGIRLSYRATSLEGDLPFLWAAHPQFAAPPGTRLELPSGIQTVVESTHPGRDLSWPGTGMSIDDCEVGRSVKMFVRPQDRPREARLRRTGHPILRLSWSKSIHHLGLWFDNCDCASQPVIAIEPTLAPMDSLAEAITAGQPALLLKDHWTEWFIDIDFERVPLE